MEFNIHPEVALQLDQMRLQLAKVSEEVNTILFINNKCNLVSEYIDKSHSKVLSYMNSLINSLS